MQCKCYNTGLQTRLPCLRGALWQDDIVNGDAWINSQEYKTKKIRVLEYPKELTV